MPEVIFFSLIGGIFSLIGGALLITKESRAKAVAEYATPFAAGALLAAAFLDLLKEGLAQADAEVILLWTLGGLLFFFILESALNWFHHHHEHDEHEVDHVDPTVSLVITGDIIHNFIDGIAIAAAFLVSVPTGIVTTIAIAAHEIPQEIGDFGLMLKKGLSRKKVLIVNILSALATTVAAVIFYSMGQTNSALIPSLLGVTAGFFIYIAVSDIIPTIHHSTTRKSLNIKSGLLLLGVLVVGVTTTVAHDYIDHGHDDHQDSHQEESHKHESDEEHKD